MGAVRENRAVKIVVEPSSADQIGGVHLFTVNSQGLNTVGCKIIIFTKLFKEAPAPGIVQCYVGAPIVAQLLVPVQLKMVLFIIVDLIFIEPYIPVFIGIDTCRIKGSVCSQGLAINAVPSLICYLMAPEKERFDKCIVINVGSLKKIRVKFR